MLSDSSRTGIFVVVVIIVILILDIREWWWWFNVCSVLNSSLDNLILICQLWHGALYKWFCKSVQFMIIHSNLSIATFTFLVYIYSLILTLIMPLALQHFVTSCKHKMDFSTNFMASITFYAAKECLVKARKHRWLLIIDEYCNIINGSNVIL